MKDAKAFLQELQTNPRARETVGRMAIPKNEKEAAECYVRLAEELGYSLTGDEIQTAARELSRTQARKTGDALKKVSLAEEDLDGVAGGVDWEETGPCESTHTSGEWCWWNDSCEVVISYYEEEEMEFTPEQILQNGHFPEEEEEEREPSWKDGLDF